MTTLHAQTRTIAEKMDSIRSAGKIPAIIYGVGINEPVSISLDREDFKKAWKSAGQSTAITVEIEGKKYDVLIHDFQIDPLTDTVIHADLMAIDKTVKVTVHVELEFEGVSPAVKSGLGVLEKMMHQIEVEALPKDLPHHIVVDISNMTDADSQIHVGDLVIPSGVTVKNETTEVVAVITKIKEEVESEPTDLSSIEVEKKGKKEETVTE